MMNTEKSYNDLPGLAWLAKVRFRGTDENKISVWAIGRLGNWEIGRLWDLEIGRFGDWGIGGMGDWGIGGLLHVTVHLADFKTTVK